MTSLLIKKWLLNFNRRMKLENRKIVLFRDNYTAHSYDIELSSVMIHFYFQIQLLYFSL